MADNQAKATPARVLLLFTLLLAAVAAALWRQTEAPASLNSVDYPTALGDTEFCPVSVLTGGSEFSAALDGAPSTVGLLVQDAAGQELLEDQMEKSGRAASGDFYIYQSADRDSAGPDGLWVKSAEGRFYRVERTSR